MNKNVLIGLCGVGGAIALLGLRTAARFFPNVDQKLYDWHIPDVFRPDGMKKEAPKEEVTSAEEKPSEQQTTVQDDNKSV